MPIKQDQFEKILEMLLTTHESKAWIYNIVHAVKFNLIEEKRVTEFIENWLQKYLSVKPDEHSFVFLENTLFSTRFMFKTEAESFLCATNIKASMPRHNYGYFYTVKTYASLYKNLLQTITVPKYGGAFPDPKSDDFKIQINQMNNDGIFDAYIEIPEDLKLSNGNEIYWVCPEEDLEDFFSKANAATRIRDYLGLAHICDQSYLFAVKIEPQYLKKTTDENAAVRPTPLDAGFHQCFKCLPDSIEYHLNEFGYTLDLYKHSRELEIADGAREFVVNEEHATPIKRIKLVPVDETNEPSDCSKTANDNFIKRLVKVGGLSEKDLVNEFRRLVKIDYG